MRAVPRKSKSVRSWQRLGLIMTHSRRKNLSQSSAGLKSPSTEKPHQPARENDYDPRQGKTEETLKPERRCGETRGFSCLSFLFRPVGFCFSNWRLCCNPRHKIRLSYCREKAFVATLCRTAEYAANPFPASAGSKGINTRLSEGNRVPRKALPSFGNLPPRGTLFPSSFLCQQGCYSPLLDDPEPKGLCPSGHLACPCSGYLSCSCTMVPPYPNKQDTKIHPE